MKKIYDDRESKMRRGADAGGNARTALKVALNYAEDLGWNVTSNLVKHYVEVEIQKSINGGTQLGNHQADYGTMNSGKGDKMGPLRTH